MSKFLSILMVAVFGLSACTPIATENSESIEIETPEVVAPVVVSPEAEQISDLQAAAYLDYSEIDYSEYKGKQAHALFFHAQWCPTCLGMEKAIKSNLSSFPDGTNIIQVDYDTEEALKAEHNIVSQSIIVVIDANGNTVETLVAPSNKEIIEAIQKSL